MVKAERSPLSIRAEERAMRHLVGIHCCHSTKPLLRGIRVRPHTVFADTFEDLIGGPSALPTLQPPHSSRQSLCVCSDLQGTRKKLDTPAALLRSLVAERLEDMSECLQVFSDGSVRYDTGTSTVAYHSPALGIVYTGRLNLVTSSATPELATLPLTANHLLVFPDDTLAVILTDCRTAVQVHLNSKNASIISKELADACRFAEDSE